MSKKQNIGTKTFGIINTVNYKCLINDTRPVIQFGKWTLTLENMRGKISISLTLNYFESYNRGFSGSVIYRSGPKLSPKRLETPIVSQEGNENHFFPVRKEMETTHKKR